MKSVKSSIPPDAVEKPVRAFGQEGTIYQYRGADCFLNGILVGQRTYNQEGRLILETPIKDGRKHGRELTWDDNGNLLLVEPYVHGKIHGTAKQYGRKGNLIGTYTLRQGTGLDVWRQEEEDNVVYVSEIHSLRDGLPHGYERWFTSSRQDLWHERHWHMGKLHGIERMWNSKGRLRRGYPRFYISDQVVSRQNYLKLARNDKNLPAYKLEEDLPHRNFPKEFQELLSQSRSDNPRLQKS